MPAHILSTIPAASYRTKSQDRLRDKALRRKWGELTRDDHFLQQTASLAQRIAHALLTLSGPERQPCQDWLAWKAGVARESVNRTLNGKCIAYGLLAKEAQRAADGSNATCRYFISEGRRLVKMMMRILRTPAEAARARRYWELKRAAEAARLERRRMREARRPAELSASERALVDNWPPLRLDPVTLPPQQVGTGCTSNQENAARCPVHNST
jgi:hypothetical protein